MAGYFYRAFIAFAFLLAFCNIAAASRGDGDVWFRTCVQRCIKGRKCFLSTTPNAEIPSTVTATSQVEQATAGADNLLWPIDDSLFRPSWYLRLLGWDCASDCDYTCQQLHTEKRLSLGLPVWQYHGKWPFVRVAGVTELCSVVFSIANAVPHILYLWRRYVRRGTPATRAWDHHMRPWVLAYAIIGINTWWWSAVFHARDVRWTQAADYFSADLSITFSVWLIFVRLIAPVQRKDYSTSSSPGSSKFTFNFNWNFNSLMVIVVGLGLGIFIVRHCLWMTFVTFDYGYNMKVALGLGAIHTLGWLIYLMGNLFEPRFRRGRESRGNNKQRNPTNVTLCNGTIIITANPTTSKEMTPSSSSSASLSAGVDFALTGDETTGVMMLSPPTLSSTAVTLVRRGKGKLANNSTDKISGWGADAQNSRDEIESGRWAGAISRGGERGRAVGGSGGRRKDEATLKDHQETGSLRDIKCSIQNDDERIDSTSAAATAANHVPLGLFCVLGINCAMALELFDFSPWWGLVDAHALWHLSTVPLSFLWYRFMELGMQADRLDLLSLPVG